MQLTEEQWNEYFKRFFPFSALNKLQIFEPDIEMEYSVTISVRFSSSVF